MLAQPLHVRDQMVGGVGRQVGRGVTGVRGAAPTPTLVELDDQVRLGIEQPPPPRRGPRPGPAVDDDRRPAVGVARGLPVDPLAVTNLQHPRLERLNGGKSLHAAASRGEQEGGC